MTALEKRIHDLESKVSKGLGELEKMRSPGDVALLRKAGTAWEEYQHLTAEVIRLSRENTNIISFSLSTREKRDATTACEAALAALIAEFRRGQSHPTR
jgi:hypothetical protein